jgi:hypothetical protein
MFVVFVVFFQPLLPWYIVTSQLIFCFLSVLSLHYWAALILLMNVNCSTWKPVYNAGVTTNFVAELPKVYDIVEQLPYIGIWFCRACYCHVILAANTNRQHLLVRLC